MKNLKVAIVCDWLTNVGGAEKVLLYVHEMYPKAPIFTSQYDPAGIDWFKDADVRTGWMQKFPARWRRFLGVFRQGYFSRLDLSEYDLIISVTGAEAKAVKSGRWFYKDARRRVKLMSWLHKGSSRKVDSRGIHVCFCHVPTQYYWQMYEEYMKDPGFGLLNPLVRVFFGLMVVPLRRADFKAARRPDYFITISEYAKGLIRKYYKRGSVVIHPPVELDDFCVRKGVSGVASVRPVATGGRRSISRCRAPKSPVTPFPNAYYIVTSRQVNWKRLDLAVKACMMTQRKLLVIGEGPEHKNLVKLASGTGLVEFLPLMGKKELAKYLAGAKGYIFPSLEPFGIAPVEAMATGCPVIAFGEGGARDYIKPGKNGVIFAEQTAKSLAEAILEFEKMKFDRAKVAGSVKGFGVERFKKEMREFIDERLD